MFTLDIAKIALRFSLNSLFLAFEFDEAVSKSYAVKNVGNDHAKALCELKS